MSDLKSQHCVHLKKSEEFPVWRTKAAGYIVGKTGYQHELTPGRDQYDGQKQEYIYFFLQQIVDEEHGFLKLNILESTGPPENVADSTRGIQAWTILND